MKFPLGLYDIGLWLAISAIILLTISELASPKYGQIGMIIDKDRLRKVAYIIVVLFLFIAAIRIYQEYYHLF